jgi:Fe-S oxidoreductase
VETVYPFKEIVDEVKASGGDAVKFCYQCGKCDTVCPWNNVRSFSMRKLIREATFGLTEVEKEEIWRCTTCGKCPQRCPRDVKQIDDMVALRRIATGYGAFPNSVRPVRAVSGNLMTAGNPLGEPREKRADWAQALGVPTFTEGMEYLYFADCYVSYDRRLRKVATATVGLLQKAGIEFGILGTLENCCGESIRKTGDEEAFKHLAKENIKTFIDHGVRKILVSSPHCYHTFKNEYPEFRVHFEVVHVSELISQLLHQGRLKITKEYGRKVAYHDPCYLGRHNGVYEQPRDILKGVPGLELREMADSRKDSLCCGMGGGRIWMETPKSERFADLRLTQALDVGAEVLATACPYCITSFEDGRLGLPDSDAIEVKDVTEILLEVVG